MRILAITNLYPNPLQPQRASFNRAQLRALACQHGVEVIAPVAWTCRRGARRARSEGGSGALRRRISDGMVIHHPVFAYTPKILRGWYGVFFQQSVRACFHRVVREFRPDVVLGCWAYPDGWAAVRLAREVGLPVAIKAHGSDVLSAAEYPARCRRTIEALRGADAVLCVSRDLAAKAVAMGADRACVHTVYNGIESGLFHPGPKQPAREHLRIRSADPLIVFVGNLVPVKGIDVLLDALAVLAREGTKCQAAIVGEGSLRPKLQSRIETLGLTGRVWLAGGCPQDQLPHWYRAASLVVLPSRSEGLPNVLLEASACGTPWIASRVGGIPEIAPADAMFEPGDAPALAERIRSAMSFPDRPSAAPAFRPPSWEESARTLAAVLCRIASPNRANLAA